MQELVSKVMELKTNNVGELVQQRINEFKEVHKKENQEWFSELCFCLLTANTSAQMGLKMQSALSYNDLAVLPKKDLVKKMNKLRCRFYNRRAEFITLARKHLKIKDIIKEFESDRKARLWLGQNIKGIGLKEASHFLRNVGYENVAILDKHVLNLLEENKIIQKPKTLLEKNYFEIEKKLEVLCKKTNTSQGELDLYLWYMKTGKILK